MKVIAVNGSPRKNKNTATLLDKALAGARSRGAETELVHLYDLDYKGCTSCFACKLKDGKSYGKCGWRDGLTPVLEQIEQADAIIMGSPIYFGSVSGQMSAFLERLMFPYSTYTEGYKSIFGRKIRTGFIYTMNVTAELMEAIGYQQVWRFTEAKLKHIFGHVEVLPVCDTYQFDDYSRYVVTVFDGNTKAQVRAEQFPRDCDNAFAMGCRLLADVNIIFDKQNKLHKEMISVAPLLTTPLATGTVKLKNRLVFPPMATSKAGDAGDDGKVSRELLDYYDEKSRGGFLSLVIIEHSYVSMQGKVSANQLSIANDQVLDGLRNLSHVIHQNGSKTVLQLNHAGSSANPDVTGLLPIAPSIVKNPAKASSILPQEATKEDINSIVHDFVQAALRAQTAGFDGIEIHSCHGYLLNQFLSPLTNKRTDSYGGDIYGRIRIHLDIVKEIRRATGRDFWILLRLGATDYQEGGLTLEDSIAASRELEQAGIDILDISGGMCRYVIPGVDIKEHFSQVAKAIKGAIAIPVMVTGGVTKAAEAEALLKDSRADLIGVGRAILQNSNWAKNAIENQV